MTELTIFQEHISFLFFNCFDVNRNKRLKLTPKFECPSCGNIVFSRVKPSLCGCGSEGKFRRTE